MFRARVLIVRRAKLYYTVSGIITPIGVITLLFENIPQRRIKVGKNKYDCLFIYVFPFYLQNVRNLISRDVKITLTKITPFY